MNSAISVATAKNWERLSVDSTQRLIARANKRCSKQMILPLEYFSDEKNISTVNDTVEYITKKKIDIFSAIYSIAINQLKRAKIYDLKHVQKTIQTYNMTADEFLLNKTYPLNERDFLGLVYQALLSEGEKNRKGSYYTPYKIVKNMLSGIEFETDKTILDPCCGSGSFLISASANPQQIFGVDKDPIAVFICKINLLLKYKDIQFIPQIHCLDFLKNDTSLTRQPDKEVI